MQEIEGIGQVIAAALAAAQPAPAPPPLPDFAGKTILMVQAHPDDEQNLIPVLAEACRFKGATCHFIVMADAASYGCSIVTLVRKVKPITDPKACSKKRREEMKASAALVGGTVTFLGLEDSFYAYNDDGVARTIDGWAEATGGKEKLVDQLAAAIAKAKPQVIFALDPRHGSSCHAGHRAASQLTVEALATLPKEARPPVWFEETTDLATGLTPAEGIEQENGGLFVWRANTAPVSYYDGAKALPDGTVAHAFRDASHRIHKTQDLTPDDPIVPPSAERMRIPLVRLADIDPREDMCSALNLRRPTFDVPGNREKFLARLKAAKE